MCLITRKRLLRVALKPKTCYKVVLKDKDTGKYYSPYLTFPIPERFISGKENYKDPYKPGQLHSNENSKYIRAISRAASRGFIHCYDNKESAYARSVKLSMQTAFFKSGIFNIEIWEVQIPKWTKYVTGSDEGATRGGIFDKTAIAAHEVKFIKKIA